jgi:hypothetical protein
VPAVYIKSLEKQLEDYMSVKKDNNLDLDISVFPSDTTNSAKRVHDAARALNIPFSDLPVVLVYDLTVKSLHLENLDEGAVRDRIVQDSRAV